MSTEAWAFFIALAILIPLFVLMRRHAVKQAATAGGVDEPATVAPVVPVRSSPLIAPAPRTVSASSAPAPVVDVFPTDTRTATLAALAGVPAEVKMHAPHELQLSVFRDALGWRPLDLRAEKMYGVFGTTGSGKGYLLQAMALQVLALGPDMAELVVIDGKDGLDYGFCHQVGHATLFTGDELTDGIAYVTAERRRRNELLKSENARNVHEYNRKAPAPLRYLFVIVDELKAFSKPQLEELAKNALMIRASGGRMVFATQYPTVDTIPSSIQAVITDRYVGRLVSAEHSGVALRRRAKADPETYEPSVIPQNAPGVMVYRTDGGAEYLGRTPNVDDMTRELWIAALAERWPKMSSVSQQVTRIPDPAEPLPIDTDAELRRLAASIDRTGTMASENAAFEHADPAGVPVRDAVAISEIAHQDAEKPVKSDLPQDDLSLAIRALVQAGLSRNKTIDLLHISGNKNAGLKRIKQALGEEND